MPDKGIDLDLPALVGRLGDASAPPAGGSGAASIGALGAALVSMAFRQASREEGAPVPAYMEARAEELDDVAALLLDRADLELAANGPGALEASLETAEAALGALRLATVGLPQVPPRLRAACLTGAFALGAAAEAGAALAHDRLGVPGGERDEELLATLGALREQTASLVDVLRRSEGPSA